MNTIETTITKGKTLRLYPTDFGFNRKTGFSVSETRGGNFSIKMDGGSRKTNCDNRLEFSVANKDWAIPQMPITLTWRKRGDSVILSYGV